MHVTAANVLSSLVWSLIMLQCVELDKFEPYLNEEEMVSHSLKYIEDYMLWAGPVVSAP